MNTIQPSANPTDVELEHLRKLYKELGWARNHVKAIYDLRKTEDSPAINADDPDEQMSMKL